MEAVKTDLMAERYYEAHDRLVKALDYIKAAMNDVFGTYRAHATRFVDGKTWTSEEWSELYGKKEETA